MLKVNLLVLIHGRSLIYGNFWFRAVFGRYLCSARGAEDPQIATFWNIKQMIYTKGVQSTFLVGKYRLFCPNAKKLCTQQFWGHFVAAQESCLIGFRVPKSI